MIDFEKVTRFFNNESIYCFTSDLDWAPELVIEETLTLFNSLEVPLTPFIMHNSETTNKYYGKNRKAQYFGLHTNFLPNSSHGNNYMQQIDFVINLWPDAKCFRSHSYFDNSKITHEFYKRGFRYDSNICLFLHPYCTPLRHQSDLIRFPVFWEDDAHWERYPFKLNTKDFKKYIDIPGLKIFNFHPLNIALNIPSSNYYKKHKFLYHKRIEEPADLLRYKFKGAGVQTLLENLISYLKKKRVRFYYLHDLYLALCEKFPPNKR